MASTETRARGRIKQALEADGHYVVTLHGDPTSGRGRSDLVVCARGVYFWLEVKTLDGHPSGAQLRRIKEVRAAGGTACIVTNIHEARWVIGTRLKGYVPYMENQPQASILDLSAFTRVAVPTEDPEAIPFPAVAPTPPPTPVPAHIVEGTGEIIEPTADAELDVMLSQVQQRIQTQQATIPPPASPVPEPEPPAAEEKPKRTRRTRAQVEADEQKQQLPLPEPDRVSEPPATNLLQAAAAEQSAAMVEAFTQGTGDVMLPAPAWPAPVSDVDPQTIYNQLVKTWEAIVILQESVARIEEGLTAQTVMFEKYLESFSKEVDKG